MWALILALLVLFYILNLKKEKYQTYHETHLNRDYPSFFLQDGEKLYTAPKYRWNYGAGYYSTSNLGKVSKNYEPHWIPYGAF